MKIPDFSRQAFITTFDIYFFKEGYTEHQKIKFITRLLQCKEGGTILSTVWGIDDKVMPQNEAFLSNNPCPESFQEQVMHTLSVLMWGNND